MNFVDVIILLILLIGLFVGYRNGIIKTGLDLIVLFISSLLAGLLRGPLSNALYEFLPFFNYGGVKEDLYSINLIVYNVCIYLLLLLLFVGIYQSIIIKFNLRDKILDSMIEANLVSKILGVLLSIPLFILIIYNFAIVIFMPIFNIKAVNESKYTNLTLEKLPIISKVNKNLYNSEKYFNDIISDKKELKKNKKYLDNKILSYMIKEKFITKNKVDSLIKKNLLYK